MYAIIETGGKQIKVAEGDSIFVELLNDAEEGQEYVFDKVVLTSGDKTKVGTPYVTGAKVVAEVEKHGKGKKIVIFKYRAKDPSSQRKQGHRQPYTKLVIKSIEA
ncbi:MAG: 50S ribosomal protein L21 [Erysipelothrix sp.]|nr:50S ribosomal protein L21 [Erysipelothrix sp.]